ncbi:polysaccharide biosynthesis protein [Desulfitobacterium sp.]|uniref:polysaccharide biosynthesis protein n=1 Tax=Desulfitobacterium sp. TaxID=49981 RepID=UPI002B20FF55|nr:polysaccharide biosynthesis protein [Desulfitobacterium sp.]MEA4903025.1 polysaccharide biosynthesis protein [Desulfitobacterium sp.]
MFTNSTILVTGGTGSWGQELIKRLLLHNPQRIISFSRNETIQVKMDREIDDPRLISSIGDVRDLSTLIKACEGVDFIFHLAALKHVPICEKQPLEAWKTNVIGTQNVIEAATINRVKKVINISTDKAANPVSFYGMTKAIGEKLIIYANLQKEETKFVNVRGVNILGSNGSVLNLFIEQLKEKRNISITDKKMIRFFMTPKSATELLLTAAEEGKGGETFILTSSPWKILDLAEVLIEAYGTADTKIIEIGIRPGEKLNEDFLSSIESNNSVVLKNRYLVILPSIEIPALKEAYASCPSVKMESFPGNLLMNKAEIKQILTEEGYLSQ